MLRRTSQDASDGELSMVLEESTRVITSYNFGIRLETGPSASDTNKPIGWSSLGAAHNRVRRACRYLPSFHNALLSAAFSMKPLHLSLIHI